MVPHVAVLVARFACSHSDSVTPYRASSETWSSGDLSTVDFSGFSEAVATELALITGFLRVMTFLSCWTIPSAVKNCSASLARFAQK